MPLHVEAVIDTPLPHAIVTVMHHLVIEALAKLHTLPEEQQVRMAEVMLEFMEHADEPPVLE